MTSRALFTFGATCALFLWAFTLWAAESGGPCGQELQEWTRAYDALKKSVADYKEVKTDPVTHRIEQELAEKMSGTAIAQTVQGVLRDRTRRLDEAKQKLEGAIMEEKNAYERCRRCLGQGRARSGGVARSYPEMSERERFVSQLPDEMLDEAFVQYRNYRTPAASAYSPYGSEFAAQSQYAFPRGPESRRGYEGFGYPAGRYDMPRSPYQGYFRGR